MADIARFAGDSPSPPPHFYLLEIEWEISQQAMEHITDHLRMP